MELDTKNLLDEISREKASIKQKRQQRVKGVARTPDQMEFGYPKSNK